MRGTSPYRSILLSLLFLSSCAPFQGSSSSEGEEEGTAEQERKGSQHRAKKIEILDRGEWGRRSSDSFKPRTVEILEEDILKIELRYSGGCEEHHFRLLAAPGREKSDPPRRAIFLEHDANGDACRSE